MEKYTVIGYDIDEASVWVIHVEAETPKEAARQGLERARVGAEEPDDVSVTCVFQGHCEDVLDPHDCDALND